jgi:putative ABC transport system permease protein
MWLVIRTTGEPASIASAVRQAIGRVNPDQAIVQVATMEQHVAVSIARQRLVMAAFDVFATVALLLATIGIYGVLSGGVIERRREIAVRAAVGASRTRIAGQVGRQAIGMAVIGMGLGGAVAGR